MVINKLEMEINKPSELTQTIFFKNSDTNVFAYLSAMQVDMFNLIFYKSKEQFIKNKMMMNEFMAFEFELMEFTKTFNKYKSGNYNDLIQQLITLSDNRVVINALGKNKDIDTTTFTRFIHKISISKHKEEKKKKIRIVLDGDICRMVFDVKKLFTKFFLTIQFSMHSKYSKILYELLKDYQGINNKVIEYDMLLALMNVNFETTRNNEWSIFQSNILKRTIVEINEKSDIKVSYEPIKEKPMGQRLQVTKIKFFIEKQPQSRLEELGLIEPSITDNKYYNKSKSKLDKLVKGGYNVIDEEMWIETDIKKNEDKYEAEIRIDTWLKDTDPTLRNDFFMKVAHHIDDCSDPTVMIIDYRIVGCFSNEIFTKNPLETMILLNEVIDK